MLTDFVLQRLDAATEEGAEGVEPVYWRLYRVLQDAIFGGSLEAGTQLPPSRQLARELGISRNTVIRAYEQLSAEGYVRGGVGSGTFVADTNPDRLVGSPYNNKSRASPRENRAGMFLPRATFSQRGMALTDGAGAGTRQWGAFMPGVPDVRMFPLRIWSRLSNRALRRPSPELLSYAVGPGYAPLRTALASYLRTARGVRCTPEQLIVTFGIHTCLQLIAYMLCDAGERVWMEDPGYWGVRSVLRAAGVDVLPAPVDHEGLQFARHVRQTQTGQQPVPRLIVVSPSHQYPLGAVMSLARRRQLLEYARSARCWVVEDDYDSEFRYGSRPLPSLQGLDEAGRVLYMGTFSKVLFPGLRMGYLVVPEDLAEGFTLGLAEIYRGGQYLLQAVMADFIAEGHFVSHIRRMRLVYAERRQCLLDAIRSRFGDAFPIQDEAVGLHTALRLPTGCDDGAISAAALADGVITRPLSGYYINRRHRQPGLVLGYGHVDPKDIPAHFDTVARAIARHI
ncbi:MAG: PLP-dependent aminotransferase family protein [Desulfovibrionaceae bacterium]|nr:PLP-dependent aminotransferase family protein [Desulfovibrionaceae bacterium]